MVDPDLVGQNRANSAAELPSEDGSLPTVDANPEGRRRRARRGAAAGRRPGRMKKAPDAREVSGRFPPMPR
jgi:hypothetical protein